MLNFVNLCYCSLYKFYYCSNCKILFKEDGNHCTICNEPRIKIVDGKEVKTDSFFYMKNLEDIQQILFKSNDFCNGLKLTV